MDQLVGKQLGGYTIVEMIGKGGMAVVYKGYQPSMNRYVAIKVMTKQFSNETAFVQRFENEARLIAQLEHAHILPVYEFGKEDGLLYIVMRYLPTGTLETRIKDRSLDLKEAIMIFSQIASALDYAHSRGVIHRDLKPANILIDAQGNSFLSDFGIAKSVEGTQNLTGTGSVVGTPTYMSPEQGLGEPIDARSDIYALGVMLFEMLTGEVPFKGENPMAVMLKHINDVPPQPTAITPGMHPEIEAVILKAMAKKREDRFQTAKEMAADLAYALEVASGRASPRTRPATAAPASETLQSRPAPDATMPAPIAGKPRTQTAVPSAHDPMDRTVPAEVVATPAPAPRVSPLTAMDDIKIELNKLSAWVAKSKWVSVWLQALGLTLATFIILERVTQGGLIEIALLSLVPGLLLYGLLRAPLVGGVLSMVLIFVPLLVHTPGLALIWLIVIVLGGARLTSRQMMIFLVTLAVAGYPLGWIVPLLFPWWIRARRVTQPVALGVIFAMLFGLMLQWPLAGGLLPIPALTQEALGSIHFTPFNTTYLGIFDAGGLWEKWSNLELLAETIRNTFRLIGSTILLTDGMPLVIATGWATSAALTVSNRRSQSPVMRALGIVLGFATLLVVHFVFRPAGIGSFQTGALILALVSPVIVYFLSQWPLQADPAAGSSSATNLRILRQTLGAFFMALGLAFFAGFTRDLATLVTIPWVDFEFDTFTLMWAIGIVGTLGTIGMPGFGPPLVFIALITGMAPARPGLAAVSAVLLVVYLITSFLFDRRRPRRWNPLGAGLIIGGPGLAAAGIFPLGPLSLGALEAQVPSVLLGIASHVMLFSFIGQGGALAFIVQVLTTTGAMLLIERLMALKLLAKWHHKLRRLLFTEVAAVLMAISYYTLGRVGPISMLPKAIGLSMLLAALLVIALGNRAMFWRQFIEKKDEEIETEDLDEDISGPWRRQ